MKDEINKLKIANKNAEEEKMNYKEERDQALEDRDDALTR